ncbi:MAG: aspartyl protease family protein [Myxococcota bacterium]
MRNLFLVHLAALVLASTSARAQVAQAEPTLEELLSGRGWVAVQLRENAFSQLEADIVVDGEHELRVQISTSFSKTIFDQAVAEKLGLEIERTNIEITGRGGKQTLGSVALRSLAFEETKVGAFTIFTAELEQLVSRGEGTEPIEAVIGSDFLTKYQAVLEIPTSKLYLRVN